MTRAPFFRFFFFRFVLFLFSFYKNRTTTTKAFYFFKISIRKHTRPRLASHFQRVFVFVFVVALLCLMIFSSFCSRRSAYTHSSHSCKVILLNSIVDIDFLGWDAFPKKKQSKKKKHFTPKNITNYAIYITRHIFPLYRIEFRVKYLLIEIV